MELKYWDELPSEPDPGRVRPGIEETQTNEANEEIDLTGHGLGGRARLVFFVFFGVEKGGFRGAFSGKEFLVTM